jgi:hypothetical protein
MKMLLVCIVLLLAGGCSFGIANPKFHRTEIGEEHKGKNTTGPSSERVTKLTINGSASIDRPHYRVTKNNGKLTITKVGD